LTNAGLQHELRNDETIRAYLDELVRLKSPVQFWLPHSNEKPFETTLEQVTGGTFSSTTTPLLEPGQPLHFAFMLDARRFTTQTQVVSTGVYTIPISIAHGERRQNPRGPFDRSMDQAEVYAVESRQGAFLGGRTLQGKLLDLSARGLRMAMEEFDVLTGPVLTVRPGDRFEAIRISDLLHTPPIQCGGTLMHLTGSTAGFMLDGLSERDEKNIARILAPRFPPSFGQDFPTRKRKTDVADRLGAPTPKRVLAKPPEVVERQLEPEPPPIEPERPKLSPVMRIRKAAKRILLLSAQGSTVALAEAFRQDGFRQVFEARTYVEILNLAKRTQIDLILLDNTMGGHWGKDMMKALHSHRLLLDTPVILVVECRNDQARAVAEALDAVHIHERRESYDDLQPVLHSILLS